MRSKYLDSNILKLTSTYIYADTKYNIKKLLRYKKVTLHGMGAQLLKTIQIAQAIQRTLHHQIDVKPTTGTVALVDDIIPEDMVKKNFH